MRTSLTAVGALAGAFSALVFTAVHQVLISPIWFALPAMLAAGAACGACIAWSYRVVTPSASAASWLRYNLMFLAMFVVLGVVSVAVFDPTTTIAALLQTNEPPQELIGRALPMTGAFMVATAVVLSVLYRVSWYGALSLLVTSATLVLLLGLNISILGLVAVPSGEVRVLAETFGLLASLAVVYVAVVLTVAREQLLYRRSA
jgi:hypothetical protein